MSKQEQKYALSTTAGLAKLVQHSGWLLPLLDGDSGARNIHLTTLELRNKLLGWVSKYFSADVALQFQQTTWRKYEYTNQDTDVTAALKTLFNLLYQVHQANTLDQSALRHRRWPLHEILELVRCQNLLKTILREDQWRETLTVFSGYWQGFEKFFQESPAAAVESKEGLEQQAVAPDNLVADLDDLEGKLAPGVVAIDKNYVDKVKEKVDKIAGFSKSFMDSEHLIMRVYYLLGICGNLKIGEEADEQSGAVQKLSRVIAELFIYLDHVETRLGISGVFTSQLSRMVLAVAEDSKPFFKILSANLDIRGEQVCVKHRLAATEKRLRHLDQAIAAIPRPPAVANFYQICLQSDFTQEDFVFFIPKNEILVVNYLKAIQFSYEGMEAEEFVQLTKIWVLSRLTGTTFDHRQTKALQHFLDQFNRDANRLRGMQATRANLENLGAQLTRRPVTADLGVESDDVLMKLERSLRVVASKINRYRQELSAADSELSVQLKLLSASTKKLQGHAVNLSNKFSAREIVALADEFKVIKQSYTVLPLACRESFQEDFKEIFAGIAKFTADLDIERSIILMKLEVAFRGVVFSINDFSAQLTAEDKELDGQLALLSASAKNLQALAVNLAKTFSERDVEELVAEFKLLKQGYSALTKKIPLTCRKFFQENFQLIFNGMAQLQKIHSQIADACQREEDREKESHDVAVIDALEKASDSVSALSLEIKSKPTLTPPSRLQSVASTLSGALQTVSSHLPFAASSSTPTVAEDEAKEDFLDYLGKLQSNIVKLATLVDNGADEAKRVDVINSLSRNIFDLRRLARKTSLAKTPLAKKWQDLNAQIDHLRERDPLLARAIGAYGPEVLVEDSAWRQKYDLDRPAPGLAAPTQEQALEAIYDLAGTIRDKLANVINKQSPDSLYFKALHQTQWQKYVFNQDETTETYTLKLLFNFLWQIREATNPKIGGWNWFSRITKLPIQEVAALLDELPAFLVNTGIADLVQQALGMVKFLMSGVPGQSQSDDSVDMLTAIAASADHPTLSPVHAVAHSGLSLVSTDVPKLLKMIASAARIKVNVTKITSNPVVSSAAQSGKIAYTQPASRSLESLLKNLGRNIGIAIWNNVVVPISSVSLIRREKREIVNDVVGIIRAPELANKAAFDETSLQLRRVLIALDGLTEQSGLQQTQALRDKIAERATAEAKASDGILGNNFLKSEWKIMAGQPFLIDRILATQQRLQKSQTHVQQLREKIPAIVVKFIEAMKSTYLDEELLAECKENRGIIVNFLQMYAQETQQRHSAILAKLAERHAAELQGLEDGGESPRQIKKVRKQLSNQYDKIRDNLSSGTAIKADKIDELFDSVIRSGIPLFDEPHFSQPQLSGMSDELGEYAASHERGVRSAQHQEMQLQKSLQEKQAVLHRVFRAQCDNLYAQSLQFDVTNYRNSMQIQSFFADFAQFLESYLPVQACAQCVPDFKLRLDIKLLCERVSGMAGVTSEARDLAVTAVQQEFQFFVKQLLTVIDQQQNPSLELIEFANALPELTILPAEKLSEFASKIIVLLEAYPALKQPVENLMAMFPALVYAVDQVKTRLNNTDKSPTAQSSVRFFNRKPSIGQNQKIPENTASLG